jgi:hypothetical protein
MTQFDSFSLKSPSSQQSSNDFYDPDELVIGIVFNDLLLT